MSGEGGPIAAGLMGAMPDPQARIFDAIDRARTALGLIDPLTHADRVRMAFELDRLGIAAAPDGDPDSS